MAETRQFRMHQALLHDVIKRQAGSLSKAILEGISNAVDAGASKITVNMTDAQVEIGDNGRGFASREEIETCFEVFGQPQTEQKVYGVFRMGRGQGMAYGLNVWESNEFRMTVDIQSKGLDYELETLPKPRPGCHISIKLYDKLLPSELDTTLRDLQLAVKYVRVPVKLNGTVVSHDPDKGKWDKILPEAYIKFKSTGDMDVYNLGVLVRGFPGYHFGCGGVVVSREQIKVNFARNDIQGDCPVWSKIKPILRNHAGQEIRKTPALTDSARDRFARDWRNGDLEEVDRLNLRLFTDVSGRHWSLQQLSNRWRNKFCTATAAGDVKGDRLQQEEIAFVFSLETLQRFGVDTVPELLALCCKGMSQWFKLTLTWVPFERMASNLQDDYNLVDSKLWTARERAIMSTLQSGQHELAKLGSEGIRQRQLLIGTSSCADGWTDGETYIVINRKLLDKAFDGSVGAWSAFAHLLLHEYCHTVADTVSHVHSPEFYQSFHDLSRTMLPRMVNTCVQAFPQVVKRLTRKQLRQEDKKVRHETATTQLKQLMVAQAGQ